MFIWTFFYHKDLGNHLLPLCPKVVKQPVYIHMYVCMYVYMNVHFTIFDMLLYTILKRDEDNAIDFHEILQEPSV